MTSKTTIKAIAAVGTLFIFSLTLYLYFFYRHPHIRARRYLYSFSQGNRYFGRLSLWYYFASHNQWAEAQKLEKWLYPADIQYYLSNHYPPNIQNEVNTLAAKEPKTVEDYIELARLEIRLVNPPKAIEYLAAARKLDPVRPDVEKMYRELIELSPDLL